MAAKRATEDAEETKARREAHRLYVTAKRAGENAKRKRPVVRQSAYTVLPNVVKEGPEERKARLEAGCVYRAAKRAAESAEEKRRVLRQAA